jgi:hypothetical protein
MPSSSHNADFATEDDVPVAVETFCIKNSCLGTLMHSARSVLEKSVSVDQEVRGNQLTKWPICRVLTIIRPTAWSQKVRKSLQYPGFQQFDELTILELK